MANTFIELNDTPSDYSGAALKFVRVSASNSLSFSAADIDALSDVETSGAYVPSVGQALTWTAGGKWRPIDIDPYSAGAGLTKNAGTIDVVATGGLVANASGVYIADIANVAGTWGNATHVPAITVNSKGQVTAVEATQIVASQATTITDDFVGNVLGTAGQIRVTGGTGNNSNATIDLVATGVTAAVYGNATHAPQITVDTYGRIQNVEMIELSAGDGGANASLGFRSIAVNGQTTIAADQVEDALTFVAGTGITIATDAANDSITFSATQASDISLNELSDLSISGIADGQVIRWVAANSAFEAYTIPTNTTDLTSFSAGTGLSYNSSTGEYKLANTSVSAGVYGSATQSAQITVDAQGRITNVSNVSTQVPSGVVAGAYGNATVIPTITVDQYGVVTDVSTTSVASHIQSLSWDASSKELTLSGGNSVNLSTLIDQNFFSTFAVTGQASLAADNPGDTITFEAGSGISLSTGSDKITINNTYELSDTGVSAGTYGNATTIPQFTVDAKGRLSNVNEVDISAYSQTLSYDSSTNILSISGQNNVDLSDLDNYGFGVVTVAGQNNIVADRSTDTLNLVGGAGIAIDLNSGTDTVTIRATGDAAANISGSSIADLSDVHNLSGIVNGQALIWNATNSRFEAGNVTAEAGSTQNLSWNSGTSTLSISDGNSVDLSALLDNVDAQTLSIAGNVITISGSNDTVDLSSALGSVAGNYGDSNVATYLSAQGYATQATIVAAITDSAPGTLDTLNELAAALGDDPNFATTITNQIATKANVADLHAVATSGDYTDLTNRPTIALSGSDLSYDGTTLDLSGVGAVGPQGNVGPTGATGNGITNVAINSDELILTYSNSSVQNLGNIRGPIGETGAQGPQGNAGADGTHVSSAVVSGDNLEIVLSNAQVITAGNVRGPVGPQGATGAQGPQGDGNAGVSSATVNGSGNLVITLNDSSTIDAGNVRGAVGATGAAGADGSDGANGNDGVGITDVQLVGTNLVIDYSNTSTQDLGNIQGPQGAQGIQGIQGNVGLTGPQGIQGNVGPQGPAGNVLVTTANTAPSGASEGQMWYATDDGHTYIYVDGNWVSANPGESPQTLSLAGNVLTISGSNSNVDIGKTRFYYANQTDFPSATTYHGAIAHSHADGAMYFAHGGSWVKLQNASDSSDSQDLSLSGNVISLTGQSGNVDLTSLLGAYVNTDAQTLNLSGNTLTISGSGSSVDLSSFAGGGGTNYTDSDVDTHLNRSSATSGQVLTWNGSDYAWTDKTVDTDTNTDAQTLSLAGNVITISGSSSSVDLTSALSNVSGGGGGIALTDLSGTDGVEYSNTTGVFNLTDTGVSAGTYGSSTLVPRITVDAKGRVTSVSTQAVSGGGGGGGSGATVERFKLNYTSAGALDSITDTTGGISSVSIDSASGGDVTVTFTGYNFPPASIMIYGYVYASNKYQITPLESSMGLREVPGGGSTGAPSLFGGSGTPTTKLRLREAETGASRSFGTVTHAWVQFVMYD